MSLVPSLALSGMTGLSASPLRFLLQSCKNVWSKSVIADSDHRGQKRAPSPSLTDSESDLSLVCEFRLGGGLSDAQFNLYLANLTLRSLSSAITPKIIETISAFTDVVSNILKLEDQPTASPKSLISLLPVV